MPELTAAALTNIESGRRTDGVRRRTITVDELAVIAQALDIPPVALLVPYPEKEAFEPLPGTTVFSYLALDWFAGRDRIPRDDPDDHDGVEFWLTAVAPLTAVVVHQNHVDIRLQQGEELRQLRTTSRQPITTEASVEVIAPALKSAKDERIIADIQKTDRLLVRIRDHMREEGYPLPVLPQSIAYLRDMDLADYERSPFSASVAYDDAATARLPWNGGT
jgi:hypothetical protein